MHKLEELLAEMRKQGDSVTKPQDKIERLCDALEFVINGDGGEHAHLCYWNCGDPCTCHVFEGLYALLSSKGALCGQSGLYTVEKKS